MDADTYGDGSTTVVPVASVVRVGEGDLKPCRAGRNRSKADAAEGQVCQQ